MKVLQEYNTFNPDNGTTGKIQVVKFHPSHNSAHSVKERNVDAIQRANASNLAIEQRRDKVTTLVHRVTVDNFSDFENVFDLVKRTSWKLQEKYSQTVMGVFSYYFIMNKRYTDPATGKTTTRYKFVAVDEKLNIIASDDKEVDSLADCKAKIRALNPRVADDQISQIDSFNLRNRAKPIVHLYGEPEEVVNPNIVERHFVIASPGAEIDDPDQYWAGKEFVDDIDLAKRYTKQLAYNMAYKLRTENNFNCRHLHESKAVSSVLPTIDSIVKPTNDAPAMTSAVNTELNIVCTATDSQSFSEYALVDDQDALTSSEGMTYTTDTHTEEVIASAAVVKPTPKAKRGKK